MWTVVHLEDIESDFSVFHRVDDPLSLAGPEFFRKATRLSAYAGVLAARVAAREHSHNPTGRPAEETRTVPLNQLIADHPDLIERG